MAAEAQALIAESEKQAEQGSTVSFVVIDGRLAGFIALEDALRPFAKRVVSDLRSLDVTTVLLTGDHSAAAQHVARLTGIGSVISDCLPETKLKFIRNEA